ncbi:zf-HC2 domain-containing protein [Streptomyces sp. 549]|uniref:maleylpyruvate isomerase N-terminal domain-containing protein n=1 Tax=Streptomyces sp. 549 TaxID=3049076 RepID=UPI0024C42E3B|nr:maleylpyruvate isomerase N-terminal domain-containing protein [Streptomyces sp. 549]MDK1472564.1 zf-HC2 domain-containing protein [Streptomyces sp. 549]
MNDPHLPGRSPEDGPAGPPRIPPPRAAGDDNPPAARRPQVPLPRQGPRGSGPYRAPAGPGRAPLRPAPEPGTPDAGRTQRQSREATLETSARTAGSGSAEEDRAEADRAEAVDDGRPADGRDGENASGPHHRDPDPHAPGDGSTPQDGPGPDGGRTPGDPLSYEDPDGPGGPGGPGGPDGYDHSLLKSLLGAWALSACSPAEAVVLEAHLTDCASCAEEALRLRDAVGLLHTGDSLDLDPMLRSRVLAGCLDRRPARIPVPEWAAPYDAETARLDALLHDMAEAEWRAPVRLRWFDGRQQQEHTTSVGGVIGHLMAVDGMVATALGLPDPLGTSAAALDPLTRTEAFWQAGVPDGRTLLAPWRQQTHALVRTVSFGGDRAADREVPGLGLPMRDVFLDRAFECWVHAGDIADAVDYPHALPSGNHLRQLIDLAARMLPLVLAGRRRAGLAAPPRRLAAAGSPARTLHLEVEGSGGGHWYIPLDSPGTVASPQHTVAHVALDGMEFCQLVAGHVPPLDAAAGAEGDPEAIRDVLLATASLSRL